jgi:hypothetical protein
MQLTILRSVSIVRTDSERRLLPHTHLRKPLIPSPYDLPLANLELERLIAITTAIELLTVGQCAGIVRYDGLACFGEGFPIAGLGGLDINTHGCERATRQRREASGGEEVGGCWLERAGETIHTETHVQRIERWVCAAAW